MAQLKNIVTEDIILLQAQHLFGRNACSCNTLINFHDVSRSHATIYWSNGYWYLSDHSRNGTLLNGKIINKVVAKLKTGSQLQFGSDGLTGWKIINDDPPSSYLKSLTLKNKILVLDSCKALPDELNPEVIFYKSDKSWTVETSERKFCLAEGERFVFHNEEWEFIENEMLQETLDYGRTLEHSYFKFCVSPDEEDIRLKLVANNEEYDLGRRTYNYLLLTLARKRLSDHDMGFSLEDQGWFSIEDLQEKVGKEMGCDVDIYYLNLQIFRLRKQLQELKPLGHLFSNAIERRPGALRFAFPRLKVVKDNACVGEILCN